MEIVHDIKLVSADARISKILGDGSTFLVSLQGDRFIYQRQGVSKPVSVEVERPATPNEPAIAAHVADRGKLADAAITVGLDESQRSVARDLLAQAQILKSTGSSREIAIAERLEKRAEALTATGLTMAEGNVVTIRMKGAVIDRSAIAVVAARVQSEKGTGKTAVAASPEAREKLVEEIALEAACQDARSRPQQSWFGRTIEHLKYVKDGGERPDDRRVRESNERFGEVKVLTAQRIRAQLKNAVEFALPKPSKADLQNARAELAGEIVSARREVAQEATEISNWVEGCMEHVEIGSRWGRQSSETIFHDRPIR